MMIYCSVEKKYKKITFIDTVADKSFV